MKRWLLFALLGVPPIFPRPPQVVIRDVREPEAWILTAHPDQLEAQAARARLRLDPWAELPLWRKAVRVLFWFAFWGIVLIWGMVFVLLVLL
jgi:hypothetical protein